MSAVEASPYSNPCTPPRSPALVAESSPINKVDKYYLPKNREQYQKFGYNDLFLLGAFSEAEFLHYLDFKVKKLAPEPKAWRDIKKKAQIPNKEFSNVASAVAKAIKDRHFRTLDTIEFRYTGNNSPPGHVTDTQCRPDIMAAFQRDWKSDIVSWPFIRLVGEQASKGKTADYHKQQAISYLHYLLLARPDLYVAQGLLTSDGGITFLFGIAGAGVRELSVKWAYRGLYKLLYAFIYRLYDPGNFADPSYVKTEFDEESTARYTINISYQGRTIECPGFYSIYARNPFATRTHVLSNPNFKVEGNDLTILKDQFCRVKRRFEEFTILAHIHKRGWVPGVVVATYGEQIKPPLSEERCKHRLGLRESGSPFTSIPTLSKVLETLFDVLEVLRYLRLYRKVLHRDISSGNVLYVENSSNRSLPPNTVSVLPGQEAETNELPLCYAKYLLGESDNPLQTSMLLVDFNLAEHLEPETSVKETQMHRTGTPIFIARAVERGGPVPLTYFVVPRIPNSPDRYANAHPDRVKKFPSSKKKLVIDEDELNNDNDSQRKRWRHELEHDAESVFWLLIYWAIVVKPEGCLEEEIRGDTWAGLNGDSNARDSLIAGLRKNTFGRTHSLYEPLHPLITDLAAILLVDRHWLPASDPRNDPYYVNEAFQRLILKFMIDNKNEKFMHYRVDKIFRKVEGMPHSNARSTTDSQTLDAANRLINLGVRRATYDSEMADDTTMDYNSEEGDDTEMVDVQ